MCGIVGVVQLSERRIDDATLDQVRRSADSIRHRGPDGYGEHVHDGVAFAMRRLSIIDVAGGQQPLFNESRTLALVANGEIYNHRLLRTELERAGHRFRTRSDSEAIIHAYEEYGDDCVSKLRGMFAFALHDMDRGCVILARDRLGEKPLYVAEARGALFFASELRALVAGDVVPVEFDRSSLYTFFHYGFIPEPHTALDRVRKLPAGHVLRISTVDGDRQMRRYWSFADAPRVAAAGEDVARVFDDISRFITDSDVPVGVALSGGLDSGAIAVLSAAHSRQRLHAFTVGYDEPTASDETEAARKVSEYAGITFHPLCIKTADVVDAYPETLWLKDDPISDIAGPGYLAVMRAARAHGVPVLLVGQGGDELFWGYPWLVEAARRTRARRDGLAEMLRVWLAYSSNRTFLARPWSRRLLHRVRRAVNDAGQLADDLIHRRPQPSFFDTLPDFQAPRRAGAAFFSRSFLDRVDRRRPFEPVDRPEILDAPPEAALIQLICDTYLRENGLAQTDRLSMAASVEVRVPMVDYRLAELAYGHQAASGSRIAADKQLLRDAFRGLCPAWLLDHPKRGFTPPVASWRAKIHRRYAPLLRDGMLQGLGILADGAAEKIIRLASGRHVPQLHRDAVALELWCRQIAAGRVATSTSECMSWR